MIKNWKTGRYGLEYMSKKRNSKSQNEKKTERDGLLKVDFISYFWIFREQKWSRLITRSTFLWVYYTVYYIHEYKIEKSCYFLMKYRTYKSWYLGIFCTGESFLQGNITLIKYLNTVFGIEKINQISEPNPKTTVSVSTTVRTQYFIRYLWMGHRDRF